MKNAQAFSSQISDLLVMVERNLLRYVRLPQLLVFSTIQPIMFLLLFTYVFGGAILTQYASYIDFLLPGILVQSVLFGALQTGAGLVEDLNKGLVDRFRSLPMARGAVLGGRTLADMMRNIFVILLMISVGYMIGFRAHEGFWNAITAFTLLLYLGFAFSWVSAAIGMLTRTVEAAQVAGFIWVFPLVFTSSIFVPVNTMPDWLQFFARINPVTVTADSIRMLLLGSPDSAELASKFIAAFVWIAILLVVFVPLAVRLYRRSS